MDSIIEDKLQLSAHITTDVAVWLPSYTSNGKQHQERFISDAAESETSSICNIASASVS